MTTAWKVPRLWPGATVALLGSGPSMSPTIAHAARAARLPRIAINNTYQLAPDAHMLVAHDLHWWLHHPEALTFAGLKVCVQKPEPHHPALPPHLLTLRDTGDEGFDDSPDCVRTGGNSGHSAVHIAAHAGAATVLLLGFDMRPGHWHPPHEAPLTNPSEHSFTVWIDHLHNLASHLERQGVRLVCGTPSALDLPYEPI